jgi:hypothetical protein
LSIDAQADRDRLGQVCGNVTRMKPGFALPLLTPHFAQQLIETLGFLELRVVA